MPKRFNSKFKKYDKRHTKTDIVDEAVKWDYGQPAKEKKTENSMMYQNKAFRDLQNVGLIEVKADPNTEASLSGVPYNIIARTNRVIDAKYAGYDNISGNAITRLQNSNDSQLLNSFDTIGMNIRVNYCYMCYKESNETNHNNVAVNREMLKAFTEAISKGYSTMLTQLPFYTNIIETDMPEISGLTDAQKDLYGKFGGLIHYQTVQQNLVAPLAKYIQTMSLESELQMMSYRREAPLITALYGLLKKKAFIAYLNSIGTNVIGEYFDLNWYKQNNTLINVPSRKSKALTDPLITATATTYIPKCTMSIPGADEEDDPTPYYESIKQDGSGVLQVSGVFLNPDTWQFEGTNEQPVTKTLEEIVYKVNRLLDQQTILTWARKLNYQPLSVGTIKSPSAYYQQVVKLLEYINTIATRFVTNITDIRTFIDKLQESGMVYWQKGIKLSVDHVGPQEVNYNVLLHNMVSAYVGGSKTMVYDQNTQRWQCYTLWNKYEGVAEFDRKSGGSFLTFGLRNLDTTGIANTDIAMCLPILLAPELTQGSSKCVATTRIGALYDVTSDSSATLLSDPILARLDPLKIGMYVKVPFMDVSSISNTGERAKMASSCLKLLQDISGYGKIKWSNSVSHAVCDPDYLCFIDVQLEDVSNEMITYCRNYSPFRVQTPDGKRTIGFGS